VFADSEFASALAYELLIEGFRPAAQGADSFKFQQSTDGGATFNDVPGGIINSVVETPGGRVFPFTPSGGASQILIRMIDSNVNDSALDRVFIDRLAIRIRY
jgi:hypothetical protein